MQSINHLLWRTEVEPSLTGALATMMSPGSHVATVLLYAPRWFAVAQFDGASITTRNGVISDEQLAQVYEARAFTKTMERRWLRQGKAGVAVTITDSQSESGADPSFERQAYIERRAISYLIWGKVTHSANGWAQFSEPRVRPFDLPVAAQAGAQYELQAVEYFALDPHAGHGNVAVIEERLIGVEQCPKVS